jgi:hypothetical protein
VEIVDSGAVGADVDETGHRATLVTKGIMAAKKKPLEVTGAAPAAAARDSVVLPAERAGRIIGEEPRSPTCEAPFKPRRSSHGQRFASSRPAAVTCAGWSRAVTPPARSPTID